MSGVTDVVPVVAIVSCSVMLTRDGGLIVTLRGYYAGGQGRMVRQVAGAGLGLSQTADAGASSSLRKFCWVFVIVGRGRGS